MAKKLKKDFPLSLNATRVLLPSEANSVRSRVMDWLEAMHVYPHVVGEFDDSALMKAFGQAGTGVFIVPTAIANEVANQFGVQIIGETEEVREQFYAISIERRISHPAVAAITETAREWLK